MLEQGDTTSQFWINIIMPTIMSAVNTQHFKYVHNSDIWVELYNKSILKAIPSILEKKIYSNEVFLIQNRLHACICNFIILKENLNLKYPN